MTTEPISTPAQTHYSEFVLSTLDQAEDAKLTGDYDTAIQLLNSVITDTPTCFEAYEELGDCYLSLRQLDAATKALTHAITLNPSSANAHYLLGFLYSLHQQWSRSIASLTAADSLTPNHPEILRCLGWSLYNSHRSARGIAVLERAHTLSDTDPNILCDLGVCYMNDQQFTLAKQSFESVVQHHPASTQAKECLTFLKMLEQRYSQ